MPSVNCLYGVYPSPFSYRALWATFVRADYNERVETTYIVKIRFNVLQVHDWMEWKKINLKWLKFYSTKITWLGCFLKRIFNAHTKFITFLKNKNKKKRKKTQWRSGLNNRRILYRFLECAFQLAEKWLFDKEYFWTY